MTIDLEAAATAVLAANWTGRHTVPSRRQYPHQWSWDSAFTAIGLRHVAPGRARQELETLFGAQWADGRLPHIVFDPETPAEAYFPGPAFWRSSEVDGAPVVETTGLIQPPVHAWAVEEIHKVAPDPEWLGRAYPRLNAWHDYLLGPRDLGGHGLAAVLHPWESGADNSPVWDAPLERIEPVAGVSRQRRDREAVAATERPTDVEYGRYIRLAGDYRDLGYRDSPGPHAFVVEDPLVNAVLARSEYSLAAIAAALGADPLPHRQRADRLVGALVDRLYDPASGTFFPRDLVSGELLREYVVAGVVPLVVPGLPVAEAVVKTLLGERFRLGETWLPASYDLTSPGFDGARYWRGPAWFPTSWLVWRGLEQQGAAAHAGQLRDAMLSTARHAGFREYVNPHTGEGHGATDFSWTAAIVIDVLRS